MRKKPFKMKGYTYPGTSPIKDIVPEANVKMPRTSGDAVLVGAASKLGSSYTPVGVEYGLDMQPINIKDITTTTVDGDHDSSTKTITIASANSSIEVGHIVTSDNSGAPSGFGIVESITVAGISNVTLTLSSPAKLKDNVTLTFGYVGPSITQNDTTLPFGGFPASRRLGR